MVEAYEMDRYDNVGVISIKATSWAEQQDTTRLKTMYARTLSPV